MQTAEISKRWLEFFASKGHTVVPSAPLVNNDPGVMFTIAGMVPFIPYFSGVVPAPYPRATSVQKCIRTLDIEEVGKTPRHGTFFQMCGNFSFGDYFKRGAIEMAWELLTTSEDAGGLGLNPEDLWITVYKEDDEAFQIWQDVSGLPVHKIQRLDKDTNFWSTGQPGPAGPCSEIFFDRGPEYGVDGGPATDDDRYVEIWNLVFMQYEITNVKSKYEFDIVGELPQKNIDTGMGLERIAFIKQGVNNMYEIDQVRPVLDKAAELAGITYGASEADDVRLRVIADHVRSGLMLISDGVTPGKDGRGYILRRLLRRVILALRLLGVTKPCFAELFAVSRDAMQAAYPEVAQKFDFIERTAVAEEQTFLRTLSGGMQMLEQAISAAQTAKTSVAGDAAFMLHDTHGFPIELTQEIAAEAGLNVDERVFKQLLNEQRERAKADAKAKKGQAADLSVYQSLRALGETKFVGYDELQTESRVLGLLVDGQPAVAVSEGQITEVVLAETTLWAEGGGQDADMGKIYGESFVAEVLDVQKAVPGLIVHTVKVEQGTITQDAKVVTQVDAAYRFAARQAHSATHVIHAALHQVLGKQAQQAGSYNKAGYMRLDFAHPEALSAQAKTEIEDIANDAIYQSYQVTATEMSLDAAKELGAMMLFSEKYGDVVRVVEIGGDFSRELCGGTHVQNSAQIGLINLVSESSVGSTNRRVEALVGMNAFREFAAERAIIATLSQNLRTPRHDLVAKINDLSEQLKRANKRIGDLEVEKLAQQVPDLVATAQEISGVQAVLANLGALGCADDLRSVALNVRERFGAQAAVAVLFGELSGKPVVVAATTPAARDLGVQAGPLVSAAAKTMGGGGGGKPDIAQGGGQDIAAIPAALQAVQALIEGK